MTVSTWHGRRQWEHEAARSNTYLHAGGRESELEVRRGHKPSNLDQVFQGQFSFKPTHIWFCRIISPPPLDSENNEPGEVPQLMSRKDNKRALIQGFTHLGILGIHQWSTGRTKRNTISLCSPQLWFNLEVSTNVFVFTAERFCLAHTVLLLSVWRVLRSVSTEFRDTMHESDRDDSWF